MSKKLENLSALMDGELPDEELDALFKDLDDGLLSAWHESQLAGDVLRSSELAAHHNPEFLVRFAEVLKQEPVVVAPQLDTVERRKKAGRLRSLVRVGVGRNMAVSAAAIALFSFGLFQTVPPLDSEVQIVRTADLSNVSEDDLALLRDYLMAHQQNSAPGGIAGVSSIAAGTLDSPQLSSTERVVASSTNAGEWMNVWRPSSELEGQNVQFTYVSSHR
ncbi:MAG TPA: sigma-E factor negative regulatory protein [Limnobacter sp.]|uniref:sigma-E factor negative regulatory protein n=1 Tax=Limnobacter sp. TaxID=2003368 RepID=UPI002E3301BF|nr:sigma-E factor negative regulatory protein [Limnobacter sp.]HEX5484771.1 sigma-E factor negative regulatory protein [Limnobacter sp.]